MQDLKGLLIEEIALLRKLDALLIDEKDALSNNANDQLKALAQQKNEILLLLQEIEPSRSAILKKQNLTMMTLLKKDHYQKHPLKDLIETFIQLSQKCAEQNLINGTVITHNLTQITRFKQVIQGQNPDHQTYNTRGKLK